MRKAWLLISLTLLFLLTPQCKKSNPTEPEQPTTVTISFTVFNHTQGQLGTYTVADLQPGSSYTVTIPNISNQGIDLSSVDPDRIAIRKTGFGDLLGTGVHGEASFTVPSTNSEYDIFLFNTGNNADYAEMDAQGANLRSGRHDFRTYRVDQDGQTGNNKKYPERVWTGQSLPEIENNPGVFVQINKSMKPEKVPYTYGSVFASPTPINGADFAYGYGDSGGNDGYHYGTAITVNADKLNYDVGYMVGIGIEEALENMLNVDNLRQYFHNQGVVVPSAQDRICYMLVMN